MKLLAWLVLTLLSVASAAAQSVQQSGNVTPGHPARWISNGVVGDGGTQVNGSLTGLGVTTSGSGICQNSAATTSAGWQRICLGATTASGGFLSVQNFGTATAQSLTFVINGSSIVLPSGGSGVFPNVSLPLANTQPICATGTSGNLAGCAGSTSTIPYWTSATAQSLISIPITAPFGGTGLSTLTAGGVLTGNGTGNVTMVSTASAGLCLLSSGGSSTPTFASCLSGSGSAGGSNTQVQFNSTTSLAGSANLTWVTPALTVGVNASATGQLVLANGTGGGASVTVQNNGATGAYNFNLPIAAGSANQPMLSQGGGSTAMTFSSISYPASATSGGVPYFSSTTAITSSAALGSGQIVLGGGAGSAPTTSANASIATGALTLGQIGSAAGSVILSGSTSGSATVRTAAVAGTATIFQLPANNGSTGQVLQTDGSGITSWIAQTASGTVTSVATSAGLTGGTITTTGTLSADPSYFYWQLGGLRLSNDATDPTNDIGITVGSANDDTNVAIMKLASALVKRTDANWVVGTGQGCRDAALSATAIIYVYLIQRSDTLVVDALCSNSVSSPTMPASYDRKRYIGSVNRVSSALMTFTQTGNRFYYTGTLPLDINDTTLTTARTIYQVAVPGNSIVMLRCSTSNAAANSVVLQPVAETDAALSGTVAPLTTMRQPVAGVPEAGEYEILTDVDRQIAARANAASTTLRCLTRGFIDQRRVAGF